MRLFVSIPLPQEVRNTIARAQNELPHESARPTGEEGLHATLFFLGEASEEKLPAIREALRTAAAGVGKIPCEMEGIGAFPNTRFPRVVFASGKAEGALLLATRVRDALRPLGFSEDKPFSFHVTICRARERAKPGAFAEFFSAHSQDKFGSFSIDGFDLMQSTLTPQGPKYTLVERFAL